MLETENTRNLGKFHWLKLVKKKRLTKSSFLLSFDVPENLKSNYQYQSGQYATLKLGEESKDFSFVSAPFEDQITFGIKINSDESFAAQLYTNLEEGDQLEVSEPKGRFTIPDKPNEKRTILTFASGIGITPILSHLKNILCNEEFSRCFLFYGNRDRESIAFYDEISDLEDQYPGRFFVFYFFSREKADNPMLQGRLDSHKVGLIINQILGIDEDDEESTIWDATDEVLICGPGGMIKSIANACFENGIRKKNIHFELFDEFNEDIYEVEEKLPVVENIEVKFKLFNKEYEQRIAHNDTRILNALLDGGYNIPYSCKSGICGSCRCKMTKGDVFMVANEYLTEKEVEAGFILPCVSVALTQELDLNFDSV